MIILQNQLNHRWNIVILKKFISRKFYFILKFLMLPILLLKWNKTCCIDFSLINIFSFVKLLNISLNEYYSNFLSHKFFLMMIGSEQKRLHSGLDKLHAWWCEHACKKVFTCTKLCAHKSIKTLLSSTPMLFKVVSYFCVWKQIIFRTIRSDIHNAS